MLASLAALVWLLPSAPAPLAADTLLPPLPTGWRPERLELPLDFAPELDYRGVEDLAFAPGMFQRDSESYFSYALALRLEGDVEVDEAMLARFLETYYRGLCRAVAESRGLDPEARTVRARVQRAGARFRAEVELFDPFTTNGDLDLVLELESWAGPGATELLGLASPLDAEAPVWRTLHELAAGWRAARPAPVFLNHAYLVVDDATYAALLGSDLLRTLAVTEERETVRADVSYTGFYLYGRRTYLEFLRPSVSANLELGASGLALGPDQEGGLDALAQRLAAQHVGTQELAITRTLEERAVPWFRILGTEMPRGPLSLLAMEYDPRFLAGWHRELAPARPGLARTDVLERYAAVLDAGEQRHSAALLDVRAIHLALDAAQSARVRTACEAALYRIEPRDPGWSAQGPQFQLHVESADAPGGFVGAELELRRPIEHAPLRLGALTLTFEGERARLALER